MTLKEYCTDPSTGQIKRGAASRVANWLGVDPRVGQKYITGEWKLSGERLYIVQKMIAAGASLSPISSAPKNPRKSKKLNGAKNKR